MKPTLSVVSEPVDSTAVNDVNHGVPTHVIDCIRQSLEGLRYGHVTIDIHDGTVVQIDRVVRLRQFRSTTRK